MSELTTFHVKVEEFGHEYENRGKGADVSPNDGDFSQPDFEGSTPEVAPSESRLYEAMLIEDVHTTGELSYNGIPEDSLRLILSGGDAITLEHSRVSWVEGIPEDRSADDDAITSVDELPLESNAYVALDDTAAANGSGGDGDE